MTSIQKVIKVLAICLAIFIILNIVSGILFCLSFIGAMGKTSNNNTKTFMQTYEDVNNIEIEIASANMIIKSGEEFKVEAYDMTDSFTSKLRNGNLKITETKVWNFVNNLSGTVTVYIPEEIDKLDIDSGAGKIEINDISTNYTRIDQGAGKLTIQNSKFGSSQIDGGAGETIIKSSELYNLKLDAGVGRIDLEAKILGNSKIECGVGEMNINLLGSEDDYNITAEKGIGRLRINGIERSTYGTGNNKIKLEGGIGSIEVRIKDENII